MFEISNGELCWFENGKKIHIKVTSELRIFMLRDRMSEKNVSKTEIDRQRRFLQVMQCLCEFESIFARGAGKSCLSRPRLQKCFILKPIKLCIFIALWKWHSRSNDWSFRKTSINFRPICLGIRKVIFLFAPSPLMCGPSYFSSSFET